MWWPDMLLLQKRLMTSRSKALDETRFTRKTITQNFADAPPYCADGRRLREDETPPAFASACPGGGGGKAGTGENAAVAGRRSPPLHFTSPNPGGGGSGASERALSPIGRGGLWEEINRRIVPEQREENRPGKLNYLP